jgi:hypothetical protein
MCEGLRSPRAAPAPAGPHDREQAYVHRGARREGAARYSKTKGHLEVTTPTRLRGAASATPPPRDLRRHDEICPHQAATGGDQAPDE